MFRPRLRALGGSIGGIGSHGGRQSAQSALAPLSQSAQAVPRRRLIHHMPISRHDPRVGVPNLLSAEGYDLAWTQHMALMLNRLNQLVTGTDYEDRDLKNIVIDTARVPALASIFNHASMAHNTDFFFKQLLPADASNSNNNNTTTTAAQKEIPATLRAAIDDNFGSPETLRREFAAIAQGMFGPGFVWLVKATAGLGPSGRGGDSLRLLTTYHAGSPYPGAHWRRQAVDMNTVGVESAAAQPGAEDGQVADAARAWINDQAHAASGSNSPLAVAAASATATSTQVGTTDRRPPGGVDVLPLLCLSTWEHVWLRDYGLGADGYGGKAAFVEAWWNAVDWQAVSDLANLNRPKLKM
ncbi:hypothetical protein SCUCBS95973_002625 [Sporothrix curviconia]|uniref:Manganese/iron superoxide dismutase C-terminal domain-containing protein n=1 Tax=Sporothrix curviconia TaxID=1260050 RepID=A0ABP0B8F2_9PEZI